MDESSASSIESDVKETKRSPHPSPESGDRREPKEFKVVADFILPPFVGEDKVRRDRVHANRLQFAEVVRGTRAPAWELEGDDLDGPIRDDGTDPYLELLASAQAGLRALRKPRRDLNASP
jgi:hypothetical protein